MEISPRILEDIPSGKNQSAQYIQADIETTCVGIMTNNVKLLRTDDGGECDDDDYEYDNDDDDDCGN